MTVATWYKLGTLTLANATTVRTFTLELTTQSPVGGFRAAVVGSVATAEALCRTPTIPRQSPLTRTSKRRLLLKIGFLATLP